MNIIRVGGIAAGGNTILVTTDSGATVYAVSGGKVVKGTAVNGVAKLKVKAGTWTVWAELDGQQTSEVEVIVTDSYYKEMSFGLPLSSLAVGTLVRMNEGSGVNYRIVHQGRPSSLYDTSCNGSWVLREAIHSNRVWDSSNADYSNSDIHSWLNGGFLALFDSKTQAIIKQVKIPYRKGTSGTSVTSGANGLATKIFLLGGYEAGWTTSTNTYYPVDGACLNYFSGLGQINAKRAASLNGTATYWTLRSPYPKNAGEIWGVTGAGGNGQFYCHVAYGIRPAMILDSATAMVNPTPNADGSYTLMV